MLTSFVLRLASAALRDGRLAGEVEHVATGARSSFGSAAELVEWCATADTPIPPPRPAPPAEHPAPPSP